MRRLAGRRPNAASIVAVRLGGSIGSILARGAARRVARVLSAFYIFPTLLNASGGILDTVGTATRSGFEHATGSKALVCIDMQHNVVEPADLVDLGATLCTSAELTAAEEIARSGEMAR
jgi:hypothetical protein